MLASGIQRVAVARLAGRFRFDADFWSNAGRSAVRKLVVYPALEAGNGRGVRIRRGRNWRMLVSEADGSCGRIRTGDGTRSGADGLVRFSRKFDFFAVMIGRESDGVVFFAI